MLSKCFNPQCSEKFRYLREGRLYRIDFLEAQRRLAFANGEAAAAQSRRRECIEHFWLCDGCAAALSVEAGADGEVHLVPRTDAARRPAAAEELRPRAMMADAS